MRQEEFIRETKTIPIISIVEGAQQAFSEEFIAKFSGIENKRAIVRLEDISLGRSIPDPLSLAPRKVKSNFKFPAKTNSASFALIVGILPNFELNLYSTLDYISR